MSYLNNIDVFKDEELWIDAFWKSINYGPRPDPNIHKTYLKKIKVICPKCGAIHEYEILVQGITEIRLYRSYAVDCGHHCQTCGYPLEPIKYIPCPEIVELKRTASLLRQQNKFSQSRIFRRDKQCQ